jgi:hypothetical protein
VLIIRRVLRLLWPLSEPILFLVLFFILVFFFVVVVFLGLLPSSDWLSPGHLAREGGSRRCLDFFVIIVDVEVNLGPRQVGLHSIRGEFVVSEVGLILIAIGSKQG